MLIKQKSLKVFKTQVSLPQGPQYLTLLLREK